MGGTKFSTAVNEPPVVSARALIVMGPPTGLRKDSPLSALTTKGLAEDVITAILPRLAGDAPRPSIVRCAGRAPNLPVFRVPVDRSRGTACCGQVPRDPPHNAPELLVGTQRIRGNMCTWLRSKTTHPRSG